ncbi:ABC transporter permease [Micromonospora sp. WMMD964]|uniref:ABC transporter permease n=1 Tax=Micromonospora TaxID=1873 RepID=UPI00249AFEA4|nr:ABC transporter permease [Micromonospora sp. WMMD964]WFF02995.1 ABC transporter permease [Micromonospora sp. WMMD964]
MGGVGLGGLRDVLEQAHLAVVGRWTRSLLTSIGVGLGVAATVATLQVTATASAAISDKFDAVRATSVTLRWKDGAPRPPASVLAAVTRLNGVIAAGLLCGASRDEHRATMLAPQHSTSLSRRVNLVAAQASALSAMGTRLLTGRMFDEGHGERADPVAVVDSVTARDLGIHHAGQLIYVDGVPVSVLGVYAAPAGEVRLTGAVVVPYQRCAEERGLGWAFGPPDAVVRTALGAADQVAAEGRLAVSPADPAAVVALVPPDLRTFRKGVEADTKALFLGLALVSLAISALGVSNTMMVAVLERRAEIGLRRAIGGSRRGVALQFLVESGFLGLAGGILGTVVAVDVTVAVALWREWLVVLEPQVLLAAPVLGLLIGTVAGVMPAWKASRVGPAEALRS